MKRIIFIIFMTMALIGCDKTTLTTSSTTMNSSSDSMISTTLLPLSLSTPTNLELLAESILSWDTVEGAESYIVTINGAGYSVNSTFYNLSNLPTNTHYSITVRAVNSNQQSQDSEPFEYVSYDTYLETLSVMYSTYLDADFTVDIDFVSEIYDILYSVEEGMMDQDNWEYTEGVLTIKESYLDTINSGTPSLSLYTSSGIVEMNIIFTEINEPYPVKGQTYVQNVNEDVRIRFELMGASFNGLSFDGLDSSDYQFDKGILIIESSFLDSLFTANPDRNVVIGYNFDMGDDTIIGIIIIHR